MADSRQYNAEDIEGFATTRRTPPEQEVITDDLRSTVIANMMDSINAAWKLLASLRMKQCKTTI